MISFNKPAFSLLFRLLINNLTSLFITSRQIAILITKKCNVWNACFLSNLRPEISTFYFTYFINYIKKKIIKKFSNKVLKALPLIFFINFVCWKKFKLRDIVIKECWSKAVLIVVKANKLKIRIHHILPGESRFYFHLIFTEKLINNASDDSILKDLPQIRH